MPEETPRAELLSLTLPSWEKRRTSRPGGSYAFSDESQLQQVRRIKKEKRLQSSASSVTSFSSYSRKTVVDDDCRSEASSYSVYSSRSLLGTIKASCGAAVPSIYSESLGASVSNEYQAYELKRGPSKFSLMSLLLAAAAAALATFMYNIPIMQKVELKSIEDSLLKNVYCQEEAVNHLTNFTTHYTQLKQSGVVILFLSGCQGCGKTHTINVLSEINPSWPKIVATHEQSYYNQMTEDEFVTKVQKNIRTSSLNFIFVDDVPSLEEGTPFVEMKLKPLLAQLKFEKRLVFLLITLLQRETEQVTPPSFLTDFYEYQVIPYTGMDRDCVTKCVVDVILALDRNPDRLDLNELVDNFEFTPLPSGKLVSVDGCKSVPINVAIYLEGSHPPADVEENTT